ncbi:MAG: PPK2 family polyphosphate kinase [Acidimicrobiia bacterium]
MSIDTTPYAVPPGSAAGLATRPTTPPDSWNEKEQAGRELKLQRRRLTGLQRKLYADGSHRLLVVLQAMDTGGKDGTIRKVFRGVNPQGVSVASFKRPSCEELAHDYLWRVHRHTPAAGRITVFNRSHYEDVLVVRVHRLVPPDRWRRRYDHLTGFEKLLADEGTTILKFYLHISPGEQRRRLQARLDDPHKHWKFSPGDLEERKLWNDYMDAYEEALTRTSTQHAPWYVVPADRKWFRDAVVATIITDTLQSLRLQYPPAETDLSGFVVE